MTKRFNYLLSICFTLALLLAAWTTRGFQDFEHWRSKLFMPFLWGIGILAFALGLVSLPHRIGRVIEGRKLWEMWARGAICGLMVAIVWGCAYAGHLLLKEAGPDYGGWLALVGLTAGVGLGLLGALNDRFLAENLRAAGYLLVVGGSLVAHLKQTPVGPLVLLAGFAIVLAVTLVTGRIYIYYGGRDPGLPWLITRESNFLLYPLVIVVLSGMVVLFVIVAVIRFLRPV